MGIEPGSQDCEADAVTTRLDRYGTLSINQYAFPVFATLLLGQPQCLKLARSVLRKQVNKISNQYLTTTIKSYFPNRSPIRSAAQCYTEISYFVIYLGIVLRIYNKYQPQTSIFHPVAIFRVATNRKSQVVPDFDIRWKDGGPH